jgi:hypothetical protein
MTCRQKSRISEADVIVAWIEIYGFITIICFMEQGSAKKVMCYKQERFYNAELLFEEAVTTRKYFIVQNSFAMKR